MRKAYTRTTIDIPNSVYKQLRAHALANDCSMKEIVLEGLETLLSGRSHKSHRVKLPIVRSKRPGSMDLDNEKVYQSIPFP